MKILKEIFPAVTTGQIRQLNDYVRLLGEWNRKVNLISRKDTAAIWDHHILPSILPLKLLELPENCRVLDIGSGGGLPAIPLKIMRPDLQMLMVDSVRKKCLFLKMAIRELQLSNISALAQRVEALHGQPEFAQKFDVLIARALGKVALILDLGEPLLKPPAHFYLWKGESDIADLQALSETRQFAYHMDELPPEYHAYSPKLASLRWFDITLT